MTWGKRRKTFFRKEEKKKKTKREKEERGEKETQKGRKEGRKEGRKTERQSERDKWSGWRKSGIISVYRGVARRSACPAPGQTDTELGLGRTASR